MHMPQKYANQQHTQKHKIRLRKMRQTTTKYAK